MTIFKSCLVSILRLYRYVYTNFGTWRAGVDPWIFTLLQNAYCPYQCTRVFFLKKKIVGISICVTSYVECHAWEIKHSHGLLPCNLQISPLTVISRIRSILFPTVSFQFKTLLTSEWTIVIYSGNNFDVRWTYFTR